MHRRRSRRSEERRKAVFLALGKVILGLAVFGLIAFYAYQTGIRMSHSSVEMLERRLSEATAEAGKLREEAETDRARIAGLEKKATEVTDLYEKIKPSDKVADLMAAVKERLADGIDPKRLGFIIRAAENPHDCRPAPAKRFAVNTPRYKGPENSTAARLADLLTVSMDGVGGNDGRDPWFDPEQPVRLHVGGNGVRKRDITGILPLEEMLVVRGVEVHFTISASSTRGFVDVATETCAG